MIKKKEEEVVHEVIPVQLDKPPFYSYPLETIEKSILLVTSVLNSLRGAVGSLKLFSDVFSGGVPAYTTIQNWILQYGLYELSKSVEKRDDWIYILDHTIEFGAQKCLLVLGITQEQFMLNNCIVKHEDVEVLRINITEKTNGEKIFATLNDVVQETGIPKQIISDHGSDIKKAVEKLCNTYKSINYSYDITHKCAILLKHEFNDDERWADFIHKCSETKRKTVQTNLGFLTPPKPRDKSRWLNLDVYVDWAEKIIFYRQNIHNKIELSKKEKKEFVDKFDKYFSWVETFKKELKEWRQYLTVVNIAKCEVKNNGLSKTSVENFHQGIHVISSPSTPVKKVISELSQFYREETKNIAGDEKWLGTSDIIESIFGKYKNFSARTPMKGVGKTILMIPVFTSKITTEKIKMAFETVRIKKVITWVNKNLGQSIFSKRKHAFSN